MGALDDIQLLDRVTYFLLPKIEAAEQEALDNLDVGSSAVDINAVRTFRLQKSIVMVGMFSLFEAILKDKYSLGKKNNPFNLLDTQLISEGRNEFARMFNLFRLLNNVLKHGEGESWEKLKLLKSSSPTEFGFLEYPEEGDIVNGHELVVINSDLVVRCAKVIQEASDVDLNNDE